MKKLTKRQLRQIILKEIYGIKNPDPRPHARRAGYRGATVRGRVERRMPTIEKLAASMGMDAAALADMLEDELGTGQQEEEAEMVMGAGQDPADLGPLAEAAYNRIVERRRRRDALNENAFVDMALSGVKSLSDAEQDPGPMRDALVKGLEEMISRMQGADSAESMDEILDFITMLEKADTP